MKEYEELHKMHIKYAKGGQVRVDPQLGGALAAIKLAMAHLERGDRQSAVGALRASPVAMQHPHVQGIMAKMTQPPQHNARGMGNRPPQQAAPNQQPGMPPAASPPARPMGPPPGMRKGGRFQTGGNVDALARARAPEQDLSPSILSSLTRGVQQLGKTNPMGSRVLQAHASALLRAHLNAARSLHQLTGSTSGYASIAHLTGADPMAQYAIMKELGEGSEQPSPGADPLAMAPLAVGAARQATGQ